MNRKKTVLTAIGLIIFIVIIGFGYKTSLSLAKHLPPRIQSFFTQAHFKTKTLVANLTDAFSYKTYIHSVYRSKLKQLDLTMSRTDINNIKADEKKSFQRGYHDKSSANKQQIALGYEQYQSPARISFHGGGANNFIFNKTDYNINILDDGSIDGISSFNLFNPYIHDWIAPLLANHVAASLNLYFSHQEPVVVKINQKNQGIYLFEEKINSDFLIRHNLANAQIIKLKDETRLAHRNNTVALNAHHLSGWDFEIANVDLSDADSSTILYQLNQFYQAIKSKQVDNIIKFIDLDYLARYDAYRELLGVDHNTAGDNLILFYSAQDNKFYPVVRYEGGSEQLKIIAGTTLKSFNNYDPHLAEQYHYPRLFLLLHHSPQFRVLKYQYLNQLVGHYPQLQKDFQTIYHQYANVFIYDTSDEASVIRKKKLFKNYLQIIHHNHNLIKQQLEFAQLAVNIINQPGLTTVEIVPDSVMPVEFASLVLKLENSSDLDITTMVNSKTIMADFSQDFNLIPTTYSFEISTQSPAASASIQAKNKITGQPIDSIHIGIASSP